MSAGVEIREFWERETCGVRYGRSSDRPTFFREIRDRRYAMEPDILPFQNAKAYAGANVLEIGVGAGSDFLQWAKHGVNACGIDVTDAAIATTVEHLVSEGHDASRWDLRVADGARLPFESEVFDMVYSYGVVHHSADPAAVLRECWRVLKDNGQLKIMVYHTRSWVVLMLWCRYALLSGRPLRSFRDVVSQHLESPGTRVYSLDEARSLATECGFTDCRAWTRLGSGDLLLISPRQKYTGFAYRLLWKLYPRWLVKALGHRFGTGLFLEARKRTAGGAS